MDPLPRGEPCDECIDAWLDRLRPVSGATSSDTVTEGLQALAETARKVHGGSGGIKLAGLYELTGGTMRQVTDRMEARIKARYETEAT